MLLCDNLPSHVRVRLVIFRRQRAYESLVTRIQFQFNPHTKLRSHTHTHTQRLGSSSCALTHTQRANFVSGSYRKQQLKEEEGSLEKQGGVTIQRSIGRGPKENAAQTPDVGTPFTHAHTHLYKDTQMGRGGNNM